MVEEQLRLITPEYRDAVDNLFALAEDLTNKFQEDIEYSRNGFKLQLKTPYMPASEYYVVTKSLPHPYPENPDWKTIPAHVHKEAKYDGGSSGYATGYRLREGVLVAESKVFENNEPTGEEIISKELTLDEINELTLGLQAAMPVHPDRDKEAQKKTHKFARFGRQVLAAIARR